ncbi:hypothetical protein RYH80_10555 [Halobaculum sp. MBLA0147]|uniref:hypothetical protein n=1 Tax=Halobaculum sp. MBLA0147 TaxID=3079934 RepID=UPI00352471E7
MTRGERRRELLGRFVWRLARMHGWGGRVQFETALRASFADSEIGEARRLLRPLLRSQGVVFLAWSESDDEYVRMRGDRRVAVAYFLRDEAGYDEFRIEATVSRFQRVDGGFKETQRPTETLVEWP